MARSLPPDHAGTRRRALSRPASRETTSAAVPPASTPDTPDTPGPAAAPPRALGSTLVLDIGKSNAKLLLIDAQGAELWHAQCPNASVDWTPPDSPAADGYRALGVQRLGDWIDGALRALGPTLTAAQQPARLITTTHGAAFCALGDDGLLLPPIDYEWDGYGDDTPGFEASLANFGHHGTPPLPQGLNAGRQLAWLQRRHAARLQGLRHWLPYPQYWAWWFSGAARSEVSSLGCHTGLWAPEHGRYSDWAQAAGLAARFAPQAQAWETVGRLHPERARAWGLSAELEVLAGVHDSNACLARHLRHHPDATVVSSGTWTVIMAPGAPTARLVPERDELVNVAVDGRAVPTARFMGGREFAALCAGADPALATEQNLSRVLAEGWSALPAWADSGGPFLGQRGQILRHGQVQAGGMEAIRQVPTELRPALAALYCARVIALLIGELAGQRAVDSPVILEGPLAHNPACCAALAAALHPRPLLRCTDPVEGTARGAWLLAGWTAETTTSSGGPAHPLEKIPGTGSALTQTLAAHAQQWSGLVSG
jgi:sugar (pentulose or hexulose) kinase